MPSTSTKRAAVGTPAVTSAARSPNATSAARAASGIALPEVRSDVNKPIDTERAVTQLSGRTSSHFATA